MATPGPVMEFLGRVAYEATLMRPFLPTYLHLVLSSLLPIYAGAHASLWRPSSAAEPPKRVKRSTVEDDDDAEDDQLTVQKMQGLSPSDAITFPLLAGLTLTSLYFIIKWLEDPTLLNKILGYYFSGMGFVFAIKFVKDILVIIRSFLLPIQYSHGGVLWKADMEHQCFESAAGEPPQGRQRRPSPLPSMLAYIPLPVAAQQLLWKVRSLLYRKAIARLHLRSVCALRAHVDVLDLISTVLAVSTVTYFMLIAKPWFLTNFMGFAFCYGTLQFMSPTTFWTGTLLLSALFFYDIYFVFFTPLMVTVATKLDVPIKLLFPRPAPTEEDPNAMNLAMLGLGDIVIPGMVVGLALRFDLYMYYLKKQSSSPKAVDALSDDKPVIEINGERQVSQGNDILKAKYLPATGAWGERFWTGKLYTRELEGKRFPKPYFYASIYGYVAGMLVTLGVMQVAQHAQPALLYLVPGVLLPLWGTAAWRGELNHMWNFSEAEEDGDKDEMEGEKKEVKGKESIVEQSPNEGAVEMRKSAAASLKLAPSDEVAKQAKNGFKTSERKDSRTLFSFTLTLPLPKSRVSKRKSVPGPSTRSITSGRVTPNSESSNNEDPSSLPLDPESRTAAHEVSEVRSKSSSFELPNQIPAESTTRETDGEFKGPPGKRQRRG